MGIHSTTDVSMCACNASIFEAELRNKSVCKPSSFGSLRAAARALRTTFAAQSVCGCLSSALVGRSQRRRS